VLAHLGFQSEPARVYAAAAALLLPSSHEGLPLVILEAFSWGLPVIAYDIPGVRDVVTPGRNGILVRPADGVDGLERALDRLFGTASDRAELGRNARADYDARYTLERMLAATVQRLESVVALESR
jgi:glycosyltransferase involved in cell wall biosynthesis